MIDKRKPYLDFRRSCKILNIIWAQATLPFAQLYPPFVIQALMPTVLFIREPRRERQRLILEQITFICSRRGPCWGRFGLAADAKLRLFFRKEFLERRVPLRRR